MIMIDFIRLYLGLLSIIWSSADQYVVAESHCI